MYTKPFSVCISMVLYINIIIISYASDINIVTMPPIPKAIAGASVIITNNKIIVANGTTWENNEKQWINNCYLFDIDKNIWSSKADFPVALAYSVTVNTGSNAFIIGGENGKDVCDTVWRLSGKERIMWQAIGHTPFKVTYAAGTAENNSIFIVGGTDKVADYANGSKELWMGIIKDGTNICWQQHQSFPGLANNLMAAAGWHNGLYVFGGFYSTTNGVADSDEVFCFSKTGGWKKLKPLPAPARCITAIGVPDKGIYLFVRWQNKLPTEVYLYNPELDNYEKLGRLPISAAVISGAYDMGNIYLLGGEDKPCHRINTFLKIITP